MIEGLAWIVANKERYDIRVVNMSLGRPIFELPKKDPLVQAVEQAGMPVS